METKPPLKRADILTRHDPLICANVLLTKDDDLLSLDRGATRDGEAHGFLEPPLDLGTHDGLEYNAQIERDNLHQHVHAGLP